MTPHDTSRYRRDSTTDPRRGETVIDHDVRRRFCVEDKIGKFKIVEWGPSFLEGPLGTQSPLLKFYS